MRIGLLSISFLLLPGLAAATANRSVHIAVVPGMGYMPETRWIGGVYSQFVRNSPGGGLPSNLGLSIFYSQNYQLTASLQPDFHLRGDRWRVTGSLGYERWPNKYWGYGNDSADSLEEGFTAKSRMLSLRVLKQLRLKLHAGPALDIRDTKLLDVKGDGMLQKQTDRGETEGLACGAGLAAVWDSRDNAFSARSGSYHQLAVTAYAKSLGGDFDFRKVEGDVRRYWPLPGHRVLALQVVAVMIDGTPPLGQAATLGGSKTMRGYFEGRYRDRNMFAGQVEFRSPVWWRLSAAAFAGAGEVSRRSNTVSLSGLKPSIGAGLRAVLVPSQRIGGRIDIGWGKGTSGVYVNLNEAF